MSQRRFLWPQACAVNQQALPIRQFCQFRQFRQAIQCLVTVWVLLGLWLLPLTVMPAAAATIASIHDYHEQPGQSTFRSKQSLRDRNDRSWQVILFKRYQAHDLEGLYLRLVGFPGIVVLDPQKPLKIATGASAQWQAQPALDPQTQALPDNSAQYDVLAAMTELKGDIPLQVEIPLADGSLAQLVVPPFVVHEWRDLTARSLD